MGQKEDGRFEERPTIIFPTMHVARQPRERYEAARQPREQYDEPAHDTTRDGQSDSAVARAAVAQGGAPSEHATTRVLAVTIIPADARHKAVLLPAPPPEGGQHPRRAGARRWLTLLAVVSVLLAGVSPLVSASVSHLVVPGAASTAAYSPSPSTSDPWHASVAGVAVLGEGGGAAPGVKAPGSAGLPVTTPTAQSTPTPVPPPPTPSPKPAAAVSTAPAVSPPPVSPWPPTNAFMAVPGHPSFAVARPADGFYYWAFGQCTWWAQNKRRDENLTRMGNALSWATSAAQRGYRVGASPAVGSTVVFQPGAQGAGGAGHVAHVEALYPGGWFLMSEMNFYVNGGGWGRVDYRFAHAGAGVAFIY